MASGMARGAAARGKRIAFGDGTKIIWGPHSGIIFKGNPNVAPPGSEGAADLEWIAHYKGRRLYNHQDGNKWSWHMDFRPVPGEIFFDKGERIILARVAPGFVLIEPNVPAHKTVAYNKQWSVTGFQEVADRLLREGHRVVQLKYSGARYRLQRVAQIRTNSFRDGLAILSRASLYIGHEGGMHHGAAALNVPGVVLFGGFIPPEVTGYASHVNLSAGAPACGSLKPCNHCREAMRSIRVEHVMDGVRSLLNDRPLRSAI